MRITARRAGVVLGVALILGVGLGAPTARAADDNATPWLGVYSQDLTQELRDGLNYDGDGVLINRVVPDSPADRAGIEKGDVVVQVGLRAVDSPAELARVIRTARPGQSVSIDIVRDGKRRTLTARLEARPEDRGFGDRSAPPPPPGDEDSGPSWEPDQDHEFHFQMPEGLITMGMGRGRLGVRIENLSPDLGDYFGRRDGKGVLIVEVLKDTPAEKAGLKAGDVITAVNGKSVADADELVSALGDAEGRTSLTVIRHGSQRTIFAELEKRQTRRVLRFRGAPGADDGGHSMRWLQLDTGDQQKLQKQIEELRDQVEELQKEVDRLKR